MRITYRNHGGSGAYWEKRWSQIPADDGQLNLNLYPGKYAERVMKDADGEVLEAGCGAGRVLLYYHKRGYQIFGIDFIETAISKIKALDSTVQARQADITQLPFEDARFAGVLAFGLYHSLEKDVEVALAETRRVVERGGLLCASVRMDNIQNRANDFLADRKSGGSDAKSFHKANYTRREFSDMLRSAGFEVERIEYVENMPLLYKFRLFRHRTHKDFNEHLSRGEGYLLSLPGRIIQNALLKFFPASFCNIMVATARAV